MKYVAASLALLGTTLCVTGVAIHLLAQYLRDAHLSNFARSVTYAGVGLVAAVGLYVVFGGLR